MENIEEIPKEKQQKEAQEVLNEIILKTYNAKEYATCIEGLKLLFQIEETKYQRNKETKKYSE